MRIKKIISYVLCAALLLTFLPAPAHAVTLTAINDSILPLDESTMPARLGGETYVPYSVFTTLGVSASENDGVLDLSANGKRRNAQLFDCGRLCVRPESEQLFHTRI